MTKKELLILKGLVYSGQLFDEMDDLKINKVFYDLYPFTTENISGYLKQLNIEDKEMLTVCASGDHVLNMILKGAKTIDYFDINPFVQKYLNLKIAAIKTLTKEEYLEYFCYNKYPTIFSNNENAMNIKLYWKISKELDQNTRDFWDRLYLENKGIDIRKSCLFCKDENRSIILEKTNDYLTDGGYYKLKDILGDKKIEMNYFNCNIKELHNYLEKRYDYIFLSNISQYLEMIYKKNQLVYFRNTIMKLDNFLKNNGQIMLSYLYDYSENYDYCSTWAIIYDNALRNKEFENNETYYLYFESIKDMRFSYKTNVVDAAFMYKKKKEH